MKSALAAILCVAAVYAACTWMIADITREKQFEKAIREQGWAEVSPATISPANLQAERRAASSGRAATAWRSPSTGRRRQRRCQGAEARERIGR